DPLTGLANRALFQDRLAEAVERGRRGDRSITVMVVDLDDFKVINDSLGHAAGDLVLGEVGERLRTCAGRGGTVARLGGDEFAVLVEADVEQSREIGEAILAALRQPFTTGGRSVTVGASLGVVLASPGDRELSAAALIRRAA